MKSSLAEFFAPSMTIQAEEVIPTHAIAAHPREDNLLPFPPPLFEITM